ncbi:Copia protein, partial [Mucuna pruriens]
MASFFKDTKHPDHVFKLKKVLYGLKQAPHAWYDRLNNFLISNGFSIGKNFFDLMQIEFKTSMMGELKFFLRLQVKQEDKGICIHQQKYPKKLLEKFKMEYAKPMSTLIHLSVALPKDEEGKLVDQTICRGMIDSLL